MYWSRAILWHFKPNRKCYAPIKNIFMCCRWQDIQFFLNWKIKLGRSRETVTFYIKLFFCTFNILKIWKFKFFCNFARNSKTVAHTFFLNHVFTFHSILYDRKVPILLEGVRVFTVRYVAEYLIYTRTRAASMQASTQTSGRSPEHVGG